MTRPIHGRRAKRAQWLLDAERLQLFGLGHFFGLGGPEDAARILLAKSAAKRERRFAARRTAS